MRPQRRHCVGFDLRPQPLHASIHQPRITQVVLLPHIEKLFAGEVLSSSNVWAVGWYTLDDAVLGLIEYWDGTAWQQVPSPNPGGDVETSIYGVRAASATNIWAVGSYQTSGGMKQTLILHWDGISWKQMPSPNPAGSTGANELYGVVAPSASNAWAVGNYTPSGSTEKTLVLHWNGLAWKRVTSPNPGSRGNTLSAVAASSTTAGAVGWSSSGTTGKTLALRWNGTAWKQVATPSPDRRGTSFRPCAFLVVQCLGGGLLLQRHRGPNPHLALERHRVEARVQPKPARLRRPLWCRGFLVHQYLGGGNRRSQPPGARHPLLLTRFRVPRGRLSGGTALVARHARRARSPHDQPVELAGGQGEDDGACLPPRCGWRLGRLAAERHLVVGGELSERAWGAACQPGHLVGDPGPVADRQQRVALDQGVGQPAGQADVGQRPPEGIRREVGIANLAAGGRRKQAGHLRRRQGLGPGQRVAGALVTGAGQHLGGHRGDVASYERECRTQMIQFCPHNGAGRASSCRAIDATSRLPYYCNRLIATWWRP